MPSPDVVRHGRQTDYSSIPLRCPIVIDNGAYHCRVGWGGEDDPRLAFRNILNRPRQRASGELVSLVGEFDSNLVKLFDFTRSSIRSPFDGNVVYQFETMEGILDYAFDRMGVDAAENSPDGDLLDRNETEFHCTEEQMQATAATSGEGIKSKEITHPTPKQGKTGEARAAR